MYGETRFEMMAYRIRRLGIEYCIALLCLLSLVGCTTNSFNKDVATSMVYTDGENKNEVTPVEPLPQVVHFSEEELSTLAKNVHCEFDMESQCLLYELELSELPASDDTYVYLLGYECY